VFAHIPVVQVLMLPVTQQTSPLPPHASQDRPALVRAQVKPVLQVSAPVALAQQASPMPPQAVQDVAPVLLRVQEKPALHVAVPPKPAAAQHASPLPPQAVQDCIAPMPVHEKPVSQVPRVRTPPPAPAQQT
jgi:hypothetical protein